ncbi:HNH endonuclease signature motif containing protein [Streptomyces sp. NPDC056132]|uniref:HNH endonuclease signature motif containing protein n=1 Tax=Streptomyces sp. NPDC056132 TaxID=3345722 RepID=UPI0035E1DC2B
MNPPSEYTRERLAEAATSCWDINEVIAFLGTKPYGHLGRYLRRRCEHFDIDITHFRPVGKPPRPTPGELEQAVRDSISIAATLRRLNRPDNSRQRALLRQWITQDGVDTSHYLGQAHQRGRPGPTPSKAPEEVLVKHDHGRRSQSAMLRRALCATGMTEKCAGCGTGPSWHGQPMTLEIDHINGDWSDNRAENLRFLCPNCHAITSTWCRGGGRRS